MTTSNYTISTTATTGSSTSMNTIYGVPNVSSNAYIKIGEIDSYTITTDNGHMITEYFLEPKIVDINVYGHDKPKVVEVEFKYQHDTVKIKSICCDEDEFDLKMGVYIAMSKLLYGDKYTTEGVEEKAHELSLKKDNEKMVNKAIKDYNKKIKNEEKAKEEEKRKKKEEAKRKEKNRIRKQKQKERKRKEEANIIAEAIKIANSN